MNDLVELGLYELVTNHPPPPVGKLLGKLSSKHARRTYQRAIQRYLAWVERDPLQADPIVIANYKGELLEYNPPATVALRLRIIQELYQEAVEEGLVKANPATAISPPAFTPDPSCVPPPPEVAAARLATCDHNIEAGRRDYALYLLAVETDVDADEVPALQVAHFQPREGQGSLQAGHGPNRTLVQVALSQRLTEALDAYLAGREVADDSPLFGLPRLRG